MVAELTDEKRKELSELRFLLRKLRKQRGILLTLGDFEGILPPLVDTVSSEVHY